VEVPFEVQQQALHPFREVWPPTGFERIERDDIFVCLHPLPIAKIIEPANLRPDEVETAVTAARALVRERGSALLAWWISPEHVAIGEQLERLGLVNEDTPGLESIENAMALVAAPTGQWADDIVVTEVQSFEDFHASNDVTASAFEFPQAMRDETEATLPTQYEEYARPGNSARQFNASVGGVVVGTASAVRGPAGVNLFGGSVVSEARGRGVYRALTRARWDFAVDHGTPALTIQAGRMSRPIVEELGFRFLGQVRVYVDDFAQE
jgi:GNAT superfamily N-acetyltransferase